MIDETLFEAEEKMEKAILVARDELGGLRTGRASPNAFARLIVDYYGSPTPIPQLASVNVTEARALRSTASASPGAGRRCRAGRTPATRGM